MTRRRIDTHAARVLRELDELREAIDDGDVEHPFARLQAVESMLVDGYYKIMGCRGAISRRKLRIHEARERSEKVESELPSLL